MNLLFFFVVVFSLLALAVITPILGLYESFGFWLSSAYFLWNIFAYIHRKKMYPPINLGLDFSAEGDKSARRFLFLLCIVMFILVIGIGYKKYAQ